MSNLYKLLKEKNISQAELARKLKRDQATINRWLKIYGDPRTSVTDPLIWIEMLPYAETRNYVKRVLSNDLI